VRGASGLLAPTRGRQEDFLVDKGWARLHNHECRSQSDELQQPPCPAAKF